MLTVKDIEPGSKLVWSYNNMEYYLTIIKIRDKAILVTIENPHQGWWKQIDNTYILSLSCLKTCTLLDPAEANLTKVERRIRKLWNNSNWVKANQQRGY